MNGFVKLRELSVKLRNLGSDDIKLARGMAHDKFDLLWKRQLMTRREAYLWLQNAMEMTEQQAHMEQMNIEQCKQVVARVEKEFPCLR